MYTMGGSGEPNPTKVRCRYSSIKTFSILQSHIPYCDTSIAPPFVLSCLSGVSLSVLVAERDIWKAGACHNILLVTSSAKRS